MIPTNKLALLCTTFCAVMLAMLAFSTNASAVTVLNLGDSYALGTINPGAPSGNAARTAYVNFLIGMATNTTDTFGGQTITRSGNVFGPLPTAVFAQNSQGTPPLSIDLGTSGLYTYLFAKYDGQNSYSEVWYVGNLSRIITIPAAEGVYGLSGWTLFGPGNGVPDGGATVMLLGAALGALGIARRFLMR